MDGNLETKFNFSQQLNLRVSPIELQGCRVAKIILHSKLFIENFGL